MFKNDKVTKPHLLILFYFQAAKALDDFSEGIKVIFIWKQEEKLKKSMFHQPFSEKKNKLNKTKNIDTVARSRKF